MNPSFDIMPSAKVNVDKVMREGCGPNSLERLPPPASSNKPLTPFSIADILGKPSGGARPYLRSPVHLNRRVTSPVSQTSPLCALQELTSKTFRGLELGVLQAAESRDGLSVFGQRSNPKKRRKSRTAFTHHQIYELEKRFLRQKYLSPVDRDQVAQKAGVNQCASHHLVPKPPRQAEAGHGGAESGHGVSQSSRSRAFRGNRRT
ncbi:hypothetical protein QTP70_030098, partial [Hemibagrus guttatus]